MSSDWYNGKHGLYMLGIYVSRLRQIHDNAFDEPAFENLFHFAAYVEHGPVKFNDGAFRGLKNLETIQFDAEILESLPIGLFKPISLPLRIIRFHVWPCEQNIGDMFADDAFAMLKVLDIRDVRYPQKKFRTLTASNFSSFQQLFHLVLNNCGVEFIDKRTFHSIGRTLKLLHLGENWIKMVTLEMFRTIFESNRMIKFVVYSRKAPLTCTCAMLEFDIMAYPFATQPKVFCFMCTPPSDGFHLTSCNVHRDVDVERFCVKWRAKAFMRIINLRVSQGNGTLAIQSNFTSRVRVVLTKLFVMRLGKCAERTSSDNWYCLTINNSTDNLRLEGLDPKQGAEFELITVIPILSQFGARPMHFITVRHPPAMVDWISDHGMWIAFFWSILGLIIGVLAGCIWMPFVKKELDICSVSDPPETNVNGLPSEWENDYSEIHVTEVELHTFASNDDHDQVYYEQYDRTPDAVPNDYIIEHSIAFS